MLFNALPSVKNFGNILLLFNITYRLLYVVFLAKEDPPYNLNRRYADTASHRRLKLLKFKLKTELKFTFCIKKYLKYLQIYVEYHF